MSFLAACVLVSAGAQAAEASIVGRAEPTWTKTSGNNNFYWDWQAVSGFNHQGATDYRYFQCLSTHRNGQPIEGHNGWQNGPGSQNCTGLIRQANGAGTNSGVAAFQPLNGANTILDDGATYKMCLDAFHLEYVAWVTEFQGTLCPTTTIDRNKPQIVAAINGDQTITNNPQVALSIAYNDATSPPWQGAQGYASNWTCFNVNATCQPAGNFDPECSIPANRNARIQTFTCQASLAQQPDGKWYFCAYSADSAAADHPNWQTSVTSAQANLSATACGYITLDRAAPAVTANASATTVKAGDLVSFSASATDANGVNGQYDWTFGDNTAAGAGTTTTHTYTQPGTYVARVTTKDAAGNTGEKTITITVTPASTGGGGGTTPPPNGGGGGTTPPPNGGGGGTTPGGGTTTPGGGTTTPGGGTTSPGGGTNQPGTSQGTTGATPEQTPVNPNTVANMAGGGGTQMSDVGGLEVLAPKSIKAGKAKTLLLALTPDVAGKAQVALVKGSKIVAQKGATFGAPGTYSLKVKLPKKLAAGKYVIRVSFTPTGAKKAVTKTIKVKVIAAKKTRKKLAAPSPAKAEGNKIGNGREKPAQRKRAVKIV